MTAETTTTRKTTDNSDAVLMFFFFVVLPVLGLLAWLGSTIYANIRFAFVPSTTWQADVTVRTMDYRSMGQVYKEIPWYCRDPFSTSDDVDLDSYRIEEDPSVTVDYDTAETVASLEGYWVDMAFKTDIEGTLIVFDEPEYPSSAVRSLYLAEALDEPFAVRYLAVEWNGYNPESLTSTAHVTCTVRKNP